MNLLVYAKNAHDYFTSLRKMGSERERYLHWNTVFFQEQIKNYKDVCVISNTMNLILWKETVKCVISSLKRLFSFLTDTENKTKK